MREPLVLDLDAFRKGTIALSPSAAADLAECAAVCLRRKHQEAEIQLTVRPPPQAVLRFSDPDPRAYGSRNDSQEATERGATAIALLLVKARTGFGVIERARKGTGCDWYVGEDDDGPPFQHKHRVEVSGILEEDDKLMQRRVDIKKRQLANGNDQLAGYVVVVGFRAPIAVLEGP